MAQIFVFTPSNHVLEFKINIPSTIGGKNASGLRISQLAHLDDYGVFLPSKDGIRFQPYRGVQAGDILLNENTLIKADDLTMLVLPQDLEKSSTSEAQILYDYFSKAKLAFSQTIGLKNFLKEMLDLIANRLNLNRGLVITKGISGEFELQVSHGVTTDGPWLSESMIQETISSCKPIRVGNIVGSAYDNKRSLIATGFLSAFTWPLMVRGECLGALVLASNQGPRGLTDEEFRFADTWVSLMSLMLGFYLRDLAVKQQQEALRIKASECPFLTQDVQLIEVCNLAQRIGPSDISVFIFGETGTGKELMAKWIHQSSDRHKSPLISINCGAVPAELLESILFGHKKGAFTGALANHIGKFEQADGGTIFLDEIGDLPLPLQVKLLRVLQERTVEPLGANQPIPVNIRIVSASNKDLKDLVLNGKFREDLYFRLAEVTLKIPALRNRPNDILLLASDFLRQLYPNKRFSDSIRQELYGRKWTGNVRELFSAIKAAGLLCQSETIDTLSYNSGITETRVNNWLGGENLEDAKELFVKAKINEALTRTNGNKTQAAKLLGITARTLFRYLETPPEAMTGSSHDHDTCDIVCS